MLRRPSLVSLLDAQANESVVLVVAPPGFGKTMLLGEIFPNVASVRSLPNMGVEAFVRAIVLAAVPRSATAVGSLFEHHGEAEFADRLTDWVAARLASTPALVIDDVHALAPAALCLLEQLISRTHGSMRWVLASRETPALPIGSWVAYGWMALPIGESELAFTPNEAHELAQEIGVSISLEDIGLIVEDTRGWPIGVRVALESWRRVPSHDHIRPRTREVLFSHIEQEIWSRLDAQMQQLVIAYVLLQAPQVDILEDAGVLEARAGLERLSHSVPFVQRDGQGEYVLHALFSEFVLEVARLQAGQTAHLSVELGQSLRARGRATTALELFLASRDVAEVERSAVEDGFRLLDSGRRDLVARSMAFLEATGRGRIAAVTALRGAMALRDGNADAAELQLRRAYRHAPTSMKFDIVQWLAAALLNQGRLADAVSLLESNGTVGADNAEQAQRYSLQARAAAMLGDRERAQNAIDLANSLIPDLDASAKTRTCVNLGLALFYLGEFGEAGGFAQEAADLAESLGIDAAAPPAYSVLYAVEAATGDNPRSQSKILASLTNAAERAGDLPAQIYGLRGQALLAAVMGDAKCFDKSMDALAVFPDLRNFRDNLSMRLAQSLRFAGAADFRTAINTLQSIREEDCDIAEVACLRSHIGIYSVLNDARLDGRDILMSVNSASEAINTTDKIRWSTWGNLVRAVAFWELDMNAHARRVTAEKVNRLSPREAKFAELVNRIVQIPRPMPATNLLNFICDSIDSIGFGGYSKIFRMLGRVDTDILLTPAELRILRAFDSVSRVEEVAILFGKSPNTVRNQLKSIYRKIGCSGRAEAMAYARRRGWVGPNSSLTG
jgi:DNA-binding CsgD family transcriptional regulator/tetratricopeptide (TPR) repeat protein